TSVGGPKPATQPPLGLSERFRRDVPAGVAREMQASEFQRDIVFARAKCDDGRSPNATESNLDRPSRRLLESRPEFECPPALVAWSRTSGAHHRDRNDHGKDARFDKRDPFVHVALRLSDI